jgi:hypothetical protein
MNFLKSFLAVALAMVVLANFAFAGINVDLEKDTYLIERNDNLEVNVELVGETHQNCPGIILPGTICPITVDKVEGYVQINFDEDEVEDDTVITIEETSYDFMIDETNPTENIEFDINIANADEAEEYEFEVRVYYRTQGTTGTYTRVDKKVTVIVEDFDEEINISLEKSEFCYGRGPYNTELLLENETSKRYQVFLDIEGSELSPRLYDDVIFVEGREISQINMDFRKEPPIGTYNLKIDTDVYRENEGKLFNFQKDLTVNIVECEAEDVSLDFTNVLKNKVQANEVAEAYLRFVNMSDESQPVEFVVSSSDPSLILNIDTKAEIIGSGESILNKVYALPTNYTNTGLKTVTVKAITPYVTLEDSYTFIVDSPDFSIEAENLQINNGLKGEHQVKLENNSHNTQTISLSLVNTTGDNLYISEDRVVIGPKGSKYVYVNIYPETLGSKHYKLVVEGSTNVEKELYYNVRGTVKTTPDFVADYPTGSVVERGARSELGVILENQFNFTTALTVSLEMDGGIESNSQSVVLNPGETENADLTLYAGYIPSGVYYGNLVVTSDFGVKKYPISVKVGSNLGSLTGIELQNASDEFSYVPGEDSTISLKVHNSNDLSMNAVVKILRNGQEVSKKLFTINSFEDKNVELNVNFEGSEEFLGKIVFEGEGVYSEYDVTFTPNGLSGAGLFGLGLGSTLGIILGIIIVVLLIVLLTIKRNSDFDEDSEEYVVEKRTL